MSTPRYRPRDYAFDDFTFGSSEALHWKTPAYPGEAVLIRAAQLQHLYATRIRRAAILRFGSVRAYAAAVGDSVNRVSRVLRGTAVMRLEDIARAESVLGDITGVELKVLPPPTTWVGTNSLTRLDGRAAPG
ncbi:hypothetical protein [Diaminobutyricimonas sp. LJ205]|uniref:hypothetical protein n=1 Tax=Diaminobutyricimonas sp. LJ205 TaxID=2683590 RepID=UPI0012F49CBB|nr:hypothetical protein [Diaminobutyricimonas sp. LJ205]